MLTYRYLRYCMSGAILLQACTTPPAAPRWTVEPVIQVRHSVSETAEAYYQLARTHQDAGNLELALTGYIYAIARDGAHQQARHAAAAIHARQGRLELARSMLQALVAERPTDSQAYNNLGFVEHLRGDQAAATRQIRHALALDPSNVRARNNLRLVDAALAGNGLAAPAGSAGPGLAALPAPAPAPAPAPGPGHSTPAVSEASAGEDITLVQVLPNVYTLSARAAVPVTAPAPKAAGAAAPGRHAPARLIVANGDGTAHLARRAGQLFRQHGHPVAGLANDRPFGQRGTRIDYRPGHAHLAQALSKLIGGEVVLAPMPAVAGDADLRVVLGRDSRQAMAGHSAGGQLALAAR